MSGPLTVEHSLAQSHDGRAEGDEDGLAGGAAREDPLLAAEDAADGLAPGEVEVDVGEVHGRLNDVQAALRGREAVARVEGLPAVDVVRLSIELVGRIEGPVD